MLDQETVDRLLAIPKQLACVATIPFPPMGSSLVLDATDLEEKEQFKIDAQRRGRKKVTKCTYQMRHSQIEILLRVDIDGPPHDNPDGETVLCPHIHIYREGCADRWAYCAASKCSDRAPR